MGGTKAIKSNETSDRKPLILRYSTTALIVGPIRLFRASQCIPQVAGFWRAPVQIQGFRKRGFDSVLVSGGWTREREFFIDNLLVRIHFIIEVIWWTGLAPWDF